jgi:Protein of unknown function (DUF2934)
MKRVEEERPIQLPSTSVEQQEAIRRRAFQIYQQRGMADGLDVDDWLQAELEIVDAHRTQKAT